jgi:hypothetical protein
MHASCNHCVPNSAANRCVSTAAASTSLFSSNLNMYHVAHMHTKMFILLKCVTSAEMGPQGGKAMNNACTDVLTRFGKPYLH